MASSGSITSGPANSYYYNRTITLNWWVNSQSIANNTTEIGWELKGSGGATNNWVTSGNFKVIIDGTERYFSANRISLYNGTWVAGGTCTLWHDSAGNKSFGAYIEAGIGYVAVSQSASGSWSLPTIARASQPSINSWPNNSPNFNVGDTITVHMNRKSASFTHTVKINYGSTSKTIATGVTDNCTFNTSTIANELYALMPSSRSYSSTISVTTYNGSTNIGTKTCSYTANAVEANVKPTFSAAYADDNATTVAITENDQQIIRNQSNLEINLSNVEAKKSATLSSAKAVINGATYSGQFSGNACTIYVGALNVSSNTTAAVTVTDSRGFSTTQNLDLQVLNWQLPTAIITTARQSHYYTPTTLNVDADYSSLDGKNEVNIKYRYEPLNTLPAANLFSYDSSFNPAPNTPPSAISVTLNADGSLTAAGTYETATPPICSVVDNIDITAELEDGETYTLSQTTANSNFYVYVMATGTGGASQLYSCGADYGSISFVVDKTTYDTYEIGVTLFPEDYGRYEQFSITEAFSLVKDESGGWSTWYTLQDNVPVVVNLNNEQAWNIQVVVADKLGTTTYNTTVSRGMPIVYFDSILSSVGINCFPTGEKTLEVNGVNAMRSVMTRSLTSNLSNLSVNSYTRIAMAGVNSFGDSLTATNDGGIRIGAGVSKILVSGRMLISSSVVGSQYIRICKNTADSANTLGWVTHTNQSTSATFESIDITPTLVDVNEGDVIYMYYYVPASSSTIYGTTFGNQTSLTVETVG